VHPFEDEAVVAGQGTVGLEILAQRPEVTKVVVSVGGGGLAAGVAVALAGQAELIATEPSACPTLAAALAAGEPTPVDVGGVAVDSLGAPLFGRLAYQLLAPVVEKVVLVEEDEIVAAQQRLWEEVRVIVEPAAACAWAAATSSHAEMGPDDRVVVVACGANVDPRHPIAGGRR
jgi:threonine dehydratase